MTTLHIVDNLETYRKILQELEELDVQWTVAAKGEGGIRSNDGRCPLKELWYQQTGQDRMPSSQEVGLTTRQFRIFIASADNTRENTREGRWPALRDAIGQATGGG